MVIDLEVKNRLCELCGDVSFDVPMSELTTFRIGGPADVVVNIATATEANQVMQYIKENNLPYLVMGNGSNMLVSDDGLRAVVVRICKGMSTISVDGTTITCESGATMAEVANAALNNGLTGLEFAHGIPGTIGGGIYMNAGAYGGELKNVIKSVTYIDENGTVKTSPANELDFAYRHSYFCDKKCAILSCIIELEKGNESEIRATMKDLATRRRDKQPLEYPSAGSTFKRPEGYFAGKLIQDAGLQGKSVGGAEVSTKHAGFVVNTGGATANDVLALIKYVQDEVMAQFGVKLETEVRLLGPTV